uniref:Uncharacterized protein n=1 Tax=Anguilla anguilla TaxID=7936 RepID=A0A0E9PAV9_ANGAN
MKAEAFDKCLIRDASTARMVEETSGSKSHCLPLRHAPHCAIFRGVLYI